MEANRKYINAAFAKMQREAKQLGTEAILEASCTRTTRWPLRCMEMS